METHKGRCSGLALFFNVVCFQVTKSDTAEEDPKDKSTETQNSKSVLLPQDKDQIHKR